jgi:hypothetical protein
LAELAGHGGRDSRILLRPGQRRLRGRLLGGRFGPADPDPFPDGRLLARPYRDRGTVLAGHGAFPGAHEESRRSAVGGQGISARGVHPDLVVSGNRDPDRGEILFRKRQDRPAASKPVGDFLFTEPPDVHLGPSLQEQGLAAAELDLRLGTLRDAHARLFHQGEVIGGLLPLGGAAGPNPGGSFTDFEAGYSRGGDTALVFIGFRRRDRCRRGQEKNRNNPESDASFHIHRIPLLASGGVIFL